MPYQAHDYARILGMDGISDTTLQHHFKLYQGYVANANILLDKCRQLLDAGEDKAPAFAEMRRRLGFEFDGMRLHEYYFDNLKGARELDSSSLLQQQIDRDFGGFERWRTDFLATGAMRGVGWALLCYDTRGDQLLNLWVTLHQDGIPAGVQPLLVLDVWEHAYYLDFQTNRADYLAAFMRNLNWDKVSRRFEENSQVQPRKSTA